VRVAVEAAFRLRDADLVHQRLGALDRGAAPELEMALQRLGELLADREHRVQRCHRILEHAGDLLAAQRLQLGDRRLHQIAPVVFDDAGALRVVGQQVDDRHRGDALARARFAHQRHRGVLGDVEADAVDRLGQRDRTALAQPECDLEVADAQQHGFLYSAPRSLGSSASRQASAIIEKAVTNTHISTVAAASCHQ
jgi:hypothetical protein